MIEPGYDAFFASFKQRPRLLPLCIGICLLVALIGLNCTTPRYTVAMVVGPTAQESMAERSARVTQQHMLDAQAGSAPMEMGDDDNLTDFARFLQLLTAPETAKILLQDQNLHVADRLLSGGGILHGIGNGLRFIAGQPVSRPKDETALAEYLGRHLAIDAIGRTPMRQVSLRYPDREFARQFLDALYRAADDQLKDQARYRTAAEIVYLRHALENVTLTDQRRDLTDMMADAERTQVMLNVELPFAADRIEAANAAPVPDFPSAPLTFLLATVLGVFHRLLPALRLCGTSMAALPVSILIVTKNAGDDLPRCLNALRDFDDIHVIDTPGGDGAENTAARYNAIYTSYRWNGAYPKKRQFTLDTLATKYDWQMFIDADEVMTPQLADGIKKAIIGTKHAAFFVRGQPVFLEQKLGHGRWNNKIALFRKGQLRFPVIKDADILSMGEIEGHYQPIVEGSIGQINAPLIHHCAATYDEWLERHKRYAHWQALIEKRGIDLAQSENKGRKMLKKLFNATRLRPFFAFIDSYLLKGGFLDGNAGYQWAKARQHYYTLIAEAKTTLDNSAATNT